MEFEGPISDDVTGLVKLADKRDQGDRNRIFDEVANLMEERDATLNRGERNLMKDILHNLIKNVEMSVRIKLAERLSKSSQVPRELLNLLANDDIEVAHPILTSSDILSNQDLVNVVKHRSLQHQLAVALRKNLPEDVSEALVETGNEHVIVTLISNGSANISKSAMEFLAEESERIDRYRGPLLQRKDLPTHLAVKMYGWVSEALRYFIVNNFDVEVSEVDGILKETVDELKAEVISTAFTPSPSEELVDRLMEEERLTPAFLVMTLRQGEINLLEIAFAKRINLRMDLMRELLYHRGAEGTAIACRAADMDLESFHVVFQLIGETKSQKPTLDEVEEKIIGDMFRFTSAESAQILMRQALREQSASVIPLRRNAKIIPAKKISI